MVHLRRIEKKEKDVSFPLIWVTILPKAHPGKGEAKE
jgi:hypothetical protein